MLSYFLYMFCCKGNILFPIKQTFVQGIHDTTRWVHNCVFDVL